MCTNPKPSDDIVFAQTANVLRCEPRRYRSAVFQSAATNDKDPASRARTFHAQVSTQTSVVSRSISRSIDPPCRSRQLLKPASADVIAHLLENGTKPPSSANSSSICRCHAALSPLRMTEASSASSPGASVSTASLISARLTLKDARVESNLKLAMVLMALRTIRPCEDAIASTRDGRAPQKTKAPREGGAL